MISEREISALLPALLIASREASARIMQDFGKTPTVYRKADGSPATITDAEAEAIIVEAIRTICDFPIVAEEEFEAGKTLPIDPARPFFLIDALDGTRDFIVGGPEFTVNIALVAGVAPVMGIIEAPATGVRWHAIRGMGAYRNNERINVRAVPEEGLHILGGKRSASAETIEPFVGAVPVAGREQRSSSMKFCLLAEGRADIYSRLGETYEWDTAAGDIIVREAGGAVLDVSTGKPLVYGKENCRFINGGFIAGSRNTFLPKISAP